MTVTRLMQCGFEMDANLEFEPMYQAGTVLLTTSNQRTNVRAVSFNNGEIWWDIAATAQLRLGFGFRHNTVGAGSPRIVRLYSGATQIVELRYDGTTLTLIGGATTFDDYTYTFPVTLAYQQFGLDVKLDAASGWMSLYLNGVEVIAYTGQTNQNGGTVNRVYFGLNDGSNDWSGTVQYDDIYIDDTVGEAAPGLPPDLRFYGVRASGSGYSSQWMGSDGDQTNNFQHSDETTLDANYVQGQNGEIDSYAMATVTIPASHTVQAVIPWAVAKRANMHGSRNLKFLTRLSATNQVSAAKTLISDREVCFDRQTTKPGGGAWVQADIDGMECGIEAA